MLGSPLAVPSASMEPVNVVVAVPAHNEEELLPDCLEGVLTALDHARSTGKMDRGVVAVGAHRCADRTVEMARRTLASSLPATDWTVVEDMTSTTVAGVRREAVDAGSRLLDRADGAWLFNTDADSLVPAEWITSTLRAATKERAVAVAGLVSLMDWNPAPTVRQTYEALVSRGIHATGHDHVYGANLAVRLDAYRAVGGFALLLHGEDHDLLRRVRTAGLKVATPLAPLVQTSGRVDPRCPAGLGALLRQLGVDPTNAPLTAREPSSAGGAGA